jgi:formylglycine-generating enzyme required for sulfatase activity
MDPMKHVTSRVRPASLVSAFAFVSLASSPIARADAPKPAPPGAPSAAKVAALAVPTGAYKESIPGTQITFEMIPIPGGTFQMGSPVKEKGRKKDEGPQREVTVRPFFMSKYETTWDAYHVFLDIGIKAALKGDGDTGPDALTFPTPPYADETFGLGRGRNPNIAVTWHAAMEFARWISAKSGRTYRLPTEAEWEYACRAGTTTAYGFGDSPGKLGEFAWFKANSGKKPQPVGGKTPNAFGLFDMHGNIAEWVLDRYAPDAYAKPVEAGVIPVNLPGEARYSHVVRGGGWKDAPPALRCGARRFSEPIWSKQDPQTPQSIWWHTEATDVGFRLVYVPEEYPATKGFRSKMTMESPNK